MRIGFVEVSLAGGNPAVPSAGMGYLHAARQLGVEAVVFSQDPSFYAPAVQELVDRWITLDTRDSAQIAIAASPLDLDALLTSSELFLDTTDRAAHLLSLPSNKGSAAISRDKAAVRATLDREGIANARWELLGLEAGSPLRRLELPVIVKPIDGSGKEDVAYAVSIPELDLLREKHRNRATYGRGVSPQHKLLAEEILPGHMGSAEGIVWDGKITIWGQTSRDVSPSPHVLEVAAAFAAEPLSPAVADYVADVLHAAGLNFGVFHIELMLTPLGPVLIELNSRLIGGGLHKLIDYTTASDVCQNIIATYLGSTPQLPTPSRAAAARKIYPPVAGTIRQISGLDDARRQPGVFDIVVGKNVGSYAKLEYVGSDVVAQLFAGGGNRDEAVKNAEQAVRLIELDVGDAGHCRRLDAVSKD